MIVTTSKCCTKLFMLHLKIITVTFYTKILTIVIKQKITMDRLHELCLNDFLLGPDSQIVGLLPADAAKDKPHEERDEINILALSHLTLLLCSNEVFTCSSLFFYFSKLLFFKLNSSQ